MTASGVMRAVAGRLAAGTGRLQASGSAARVVLRPLPGPLQGCIVATVGDRHCGGDVVMRLVHGCVHEHLHEVALCQFHVEMIAKKPMWCGACENAGDACEQVLLGERNEDGQLVATPRPLNTAADAVGGGSEEMT